LQPIPGGEALQQMATKTLTAEQPIPVAPQWKPAVNPWLIASTVALGAFMEVLDTSIANVALPHIAGSLGASQDESTWVLTAYLVSNAVVLPMGGWAASIIGRKRFFQLCLIIFTVSSFLCGLAPTLPILLLCRVIQGAGGGGLQPMAQAIMADSFEPHQRGLAFSLYGLVAVLAPSIGPTLGGWITDNYNWNWIFYINIPVGILSIILTQRLVEDPPWMKADKKNLSRIDSPGLILLVLSMASLQIMLDKGEEKDWFHSSFIQVSGVSFAITFLALILWEWRAKQPLMDLKLLKSRNFAVCCFLMLITGGLLNASTVLQPQFEQASLGYTATVAGLSLSAGGLLLVLLMPMAGQALARVPARNLVLFGFTLYAVAYFYTATHLNLALSFGTNSWLRVIQVVAIPFVFISVTTAGYFGMPSNKSNQISGLINFVRNIGGSILISLTGAAITERGQFHANLLLKYVTPGSPIFQAQLRSLQHSLSGSFGPANATYLAQAQIYSRLQAQANVLAYVDVYFLLCVLSLLMIPLTLLLRRNDPKESAKNQVAVH
jgi:DHA2 family multidrug resistance protein